MRSFNSWQDVIDHVNADLPIFYRAPMDARPRRIAAAVRSGCKIRVYLLTNDADSFTADERHLERFLTE
jgi:hypothetical protein